VTTKITNNSAAHVDISATRNRAASITKPLSGCLEIDLEPVEVVRGRIKQSVGDA